MKESMSLPIKLLKPPGLSSPPTYSQAVTWEGPSRTILTAGQIGRDKDGNIPASLEAQVSLALVNLQRCLDEAGAGIKDIAMLRYYIVNYDPANRPHSKLVSDWLGGHKPATTLIPLTALATPELLFEIEATAAVRIPTSPTIVTSRPDEYDVVVVGAGLSGLQAACDIQKAGLSCIVLEARDRVGGKTWTRETSNGKLVDVGAAWINDTNQSKMFGLAKKFGLELIQQRIEGQCLFHREHNKSLQFPYGQLPTGFAKKDAEEAAKIRDLVESICHEIEIRNPQGQDDNITLEVFVKKAGVGHMAQSLVTLWTRAMLGCEPSDMSALFFLDYCKSGGGLLQMRSDGKDGGQYLRLRRGTQSFSYELAATLSTGSVILNTAVTGIAQRGTHEIVVKTTNGTQYVARKVVLSIPTTLYEDIAFDPPLPADKLRYTRSTQMGYYSKLIMVYVKPWWREQGLNGLTQSVTGPISLTRDTSDDDAGQYSLTCFITGTPGLKWSRLGRHRRRETALEQLVVMFGGDNRQNIHDYADAVEQEWSKDQWSRGAPSPVTLPGVLSKDGHALRRPHGGVHFVGTETSYEWKGYMEGAVRAGERGADEVVRALSNNNKQSARSAKL